MDNDINLVDYSRQAEFDGEIQQVLLDKQRNHHVIIGCGGVGFWLGLMLAMQGYDRFTLIDGDKIDNSNLNRLPVPQTWIGTNKAVALRKMIRFLRPTTIITALAAHITPETITLLNTLTEKQMEDYSINAVRFWDTTDDARIQQRIKTMVEELIKARGAQRVMYRKIGYEGWKVGNYADYNVWLDEATYRPGYRTARANAITSAVSASLGFLGMAFNSPDIDIDLKKLLTKGKKK